MPPMGSFATGDPSLDELVGAEAKLLDGKVGRLGTLQNLVIIGGSAPETEPTGACYPCALLQLK